MLVVDAEVQITAGGRVFAASVQNLLVELKAQCAGPPTKSRCSLIPLGGRDRAIELGELRGKATISGAADLTQVMCASAEGTIDLGNSIKLTVRTPKLRGRQFDVSFDGKIDLDLIKSLHAVEATPAT